MVIVLGHVNTALFSCLWEQLSFFVMLCVLLGVLTVLRVSLAICLLVSRRPAGYIIRPHY